LHKLLCRDNIFEMVEILVPIGFALFVFLVMAYGVDAEGKLFTRAPKVRLGFLRHVVPHYPYSVSSNEVKRIKAEGREPEKNPVNQTTVSAYLLWCLGVMLLFPVVSAVFWAIREANPSDLTVKAFTIAFVISLCAPILASFLFAILPGAFADPKMDS